jgi:hypothetical protein
MPNGTAKTRRFSSQLQTGAVFTRRRGKKIAPRIIGAHFAAGAHKITWQQ